MSASESEPSSAEEEPQDEVEPVRENENVENMETGPDSAVTGQDAAETEDRQEVAPKKKVVRNPQPKLNAERLKTPKGLLMLNQIFKNVQFQGRNHEEEDLTTLMKNCEHWCHRLFPKYPFDVCLSVLEKLGTKKETKTFVKRLRMDLVGEDIIQQEEVSQTVSDNDDELFDVVAGHPPCPRDSPLEPQSSDSGLTDEQAERIRINRERAQRLRKQQQEDPPSLNQINFDGVSSSEPPEKDASKESIVEKLDRTPPRIYESISVQTTAQVHQTSPTLPVNKPCFKKNTNAKAKVRCSFADLDAIESVTQSKNSLSPSRRSAKRPAQNLDAIESVTESNTSLSPSRRSAKRPLQNLDAIEPVTQSKNSLSPSRRSPKRPSQNLDAIKPVAQSKNSLSPSRRSNESRGSVERSSQNLEAVEPVTQSTNSLSPSRRSATRPSQNLDAIEPATPSKNSLSPSRRSDESRRSVERTSPKSVVDTTSLSNTEKKIGTWNSSEIVLVNDAEVSAIVKIPDQLSQESIGDEIQKSFSDKSIVTTMSEPMDSAEITLVNDVQVSTSDANFSQDFAKIK